MTMRKWLSRPWAAYVAGLTVLVAVYTALAWPEVHASDLVLPGIVVVLSGLLTGFIVPILRDKLPRNIEGPVLAAIGALAATVIFRLLSR